jgi:hypothetical protein
MRYDALKIPDPEAWLDLDEQERLAQVIEYHPGHSGEDVHLDRHMTSTQSGRWRPGEDGWLAAPLDAFHWVQCCC